MMVVCGGGGGGGGWWFLLSNWNHFFLFQFNTQFPELTWSTFKLRPLESYENKSQSAEHSNGKKESFFSCRGLLLGFF